MLDQNLLYAGLSAYVQSTGNKLIIGTKKPSNAYPLSIENLFLSTISASVFTQNGQDVYFIDSQAFDSSYDFDFTDKDYHRKQIVIAKGLKYVKPGGSYLYGMKKNNDDSINDWVIAYCGTHVDKKLGMDEKGRDCYASKSGSNACGLYCAFDPKTALKYGLKFEYQGSRYQIVFQIHVRSIQVQFVGHSETHEGDLYRLERETDIRPCSVCIFKDQILDNESYIFESNPNNCIIM